jgi:hypothetical protein
MNTAYKNQQGYIALLSLLIVVAAGLTIGLTLSLAGIDEMQVSASRSEAARASTIAQACIEEGLERLRESFSNFSTTLSLNGDSCILSVTVSGPSATVAATGTVDTYIQKITMTVDTSLEVTSWIEE